MFLFGEKSLSPEPEPEPLSRQEKRATLRQAKYLLLKPLTDFSSDEGKILRDILGTTGNIQIQNSLKKANLEMVTTELAKFAYQNLHLSRLSKNKFSKGWKDLVLDGENEQEKVARIVSKILIPVEKDKSGSDYLKRFLDHFPMDQLGGFVPSDTRSVKDPSFADVMEKHKSEFLARHIWENLKSGRGWVHVVELDQDTDEILKIVRQFAEEDPNFWKEKPYWDMVMTINYLPLLNNESGVFYTANFTAERIPHQVLYKMMMESANEEVRRIATDSYDLDSQSFKYADKFALFKINEFGVETWVNGVHLSSCGSIKDVQKNKEEYELVAAINRVLPEGSIFIGDMNVSLIEEAECRFGKITEDMKKSWPVQKSENNVTTNMTYGYTLWITMLPKPLKV